MEYVYFLDDKNSLKLNDRMHIINKNSIVKNDIVQGFLGILKFIIYDNKLNYIMEIIEKDNIVSEEIDYDTIIVSNNELVDELTKYFYYYNEKYDNKYLKEINMEKKIWYFFYFKRNIDIIMFINAFYKMQNIDVKWYIGKYKSYEELKIKVKNYFIFLFGKYNFNYDNLDAFVTLIDMYYKNETISFSKLKLLFIDFPFMLDYFNSSMYNIHNFYLFFVKNNNKYFIINNYSINILILYFYSRSYIDFLNYTFNYDKKINDIIFLKRIYIYSMCYLKIYEYTKLISMILYNHDNINYLLYDFKIEDNNFKLIKYTMKDKEFIKIKYKNL